MRIRLTQVDRKLPSLALMKLAHYHRARGDDRPWRDLELNPLDGRHMTPRESTVEPFEHRCHRSHQRRARRTNRSPYGYSRPFKYHAYQAGENFMSNDEETDKTSTDSSTETLDGFDDEQFDLDAVNADIAAGAKALSHLLTYAAHDWNRWSITIRGLRALRDLALAKAHTRDIKSWHYRQQLGALLRLRKHSIYDRIDKQTRSSCYKLMDHLDEIDHWYIALPASDQIRWKQPSTVPSTCSPESSTGTISQRRPARRSRSPRPMRHCCGRS
jgi:hypothetical protein